MWDAEIPARALKDAIAKAGGAESAELVVHLYDKDRVSKDDPIGMARLKFSAAANGTNQVDVVPAPGATNKANAKASGVLTVELTKSLKPDDVLSEAMGWMAGYHEVEDEGIDRARELIERHSAKLGDGALDTSHVDAHGNTVLHYAVLGGDKCSKEKLDDFVRFLVKDAGFDINQHNKNGGWTPFHVVVQAESYGTPDMMRLLAELGANVDALTKGDDKEHALVLCMRNGAEGLERAKTLKELGANLKDVKMDDGDSAKADIEFDQYKKFAPNMAEWLALFD